MSYGRESIRDTRGTSRSALAHDDADGRVGEEDDVEDDGRKDGAGVRGRADGHRQVATRERSTQEALTDGSSELSYVSKPEREAARLRVAISGVQFFRGFTRHALCRRPSTQPPP